jgi:hypothetical protein
MTHELDEAALWQAALVIATEQSGSHATADNCLPTAHRAVTAYLATATLEKRLEEARDVIQDAAEAFHARSCAGIGDWQDCPHCAESLQRKWLATTEEEK